MKLCVLCWWLALAAFAGIGLFRWTQHFDLTPPVLDRPDVALDAIAQRHLGLENGAVILKRELATFPPDAPIVVLGQGNDWTLSDVYQLVSYLAWPRPVWSVGLMPAGEKAKFDFPPPPNVQAAGFVLYKTAAPPGAPVRQLNDRVAIGNLAP